MASHGGIHTGRHVISWLLCSLQAKSVQPLFNVMVDAVARDEQYLEDTLEAAARWVTRHKGSKIYGPLPGTQPSKRFQRCLGLSS